MRELISHMDFRTRPWLGWALGVMLLNVDATFGQVVQLPSQRVFSTTGGVVVPDRGSANMGSVRRSSVSRTSRGLPLLSGARNTAISSSSGTSGVQVHATIIDLDEMDKAVRAEAVRAEAGNMRERSMIARSERNRGIQTSPEIRSRARFIARNISRNRIQSPRSPADREAEQKRLVAKQREIDELIRKGDVARAQGKLNVAKTFYRTAQRLNNQG